MYETAPQRTALFVLLGSIALQGCAKVEPVEPPDPDAFPKAVQKLERISDEVISAIEEDRLKEADGPLHEVGIALKVVRMQAAEFGDEQRQAVEGAVESLLDSFSEVHAPMHNKEFLETGETPEDFDAQAIAEDLRKGIEELRAALPQELVERVDALKQAVASQE